MASNSAAASKGAMKISKVEEDCIFNNQLNGKQGAKEIAKKPEEPIMNFNEHSTNTTTIAPFQLRPHILTKGNYTRDNSVFSDNVEENNGFSDNEEKQNSGFIDNEEEENSSFSENEGENNGFSDYEEEEEDVDVSDVSDEYDPLDSGFYLRKKDGTFRHQTHEELLHEIEWRF